MNSGVVDATLRFRKQTRAGWFAESNGYDIPVTFRKRGVTLPISECPEHVSHEILDLFDGLRELNPCVDAVRSVFYDDKSCSCFRFTVSKGLARCLNVALPDDRFVEVVSKLNGCAVCVEFDVDCDE